MVWRPRNETQDDLAREGAAGRMIEAAWGVRCVKLSEALYSVDWAFFRQERLVGWGEYKHRAKRYPTLLLSASKWFKGCQLARESGMPFTIFVEWPDGLYWHRAAIETLPITLGGSSRGQNGDLEPCVHFDTDLFRKVEYPT